MRRVAWIALLAPILAGANEYPLALPLGLEAQALRIPPDNPMTEDKVRLGKQLFFDPRWSKTGTVSCSSCHRPDKGWSDDRRFSVDHDGKPTRRHAPTLINRAFGEIEGWAGHRSGTEDLLGKLPFTSAEAIAKNVAPVAEYRRQFQNVFGTDATLEGATKAIAAYQRTIVSGNSAYDRFRAGDASALSPAARRGLALFEGKARCAKCHTGFNFSDEGFHNTGVGTQAESADLGRFEVTRRAVNKAAFKTPTLRDVAQRGPYMHDGSLATLPEVIAFYDRGGVANPSLSPEMARLDLSPAEQRDLVAFLEALSGEIPVSALKPPVLPR